MKYIAGAIFILAAAILFGAVAIAEAVHSGGSFSCFEVIAGAILVLIGLGFISAGLTEQQAGQDDPMLRAALRRAPKAKTTTENQPPQDVTDSV